METVDILETACFPKGCLIDREMQLMLATDLVPKLKATGLTLPEWTRGAALLEEPHLSRVKAIVCRGCMLTSCLHNSRYSPIAEDDPLRRAFNLPYGDRLDFEQEVLEKILPADEVRKLEEHGLEVFRWMSSSRNQVHITIRIGEKHIDYSSNLRQRRVDFRVNNEEQPAPTSITSISDVVRSITDDGIGA
ncbi:hypothetical protein MYX07_05640 [Patescibacteria group bacterium AH-259-L07]|nr:hypothetical protein [Patescibacteria group bacterium AH-259-L07]